MNQSLMNYKIIVQYIICACSPVSFPYFYLENRPGLIVDLPHIHNLFEVLLFDFRQLMVGMLDRL